jgi:CO/xanthine dehydrogenase Mo-binding subunit
LETASDFFECSPNDLVIEAGRVAIAGVPERSITLGELARMANPMRGAVKADAEPGLEATRYFGPPKGATSNGVHAVIVEIDPETCDLKIQKYVVVHDCGTLINPLIVEGQVRGGVAQGIGNAYFEHLIYNQEGQLLTASLADYLLPTSNEIPRIEIDHVVTPSPLNPLGVKGVGEAGAIPGGALFAQAIEDALNLPARGVELNSIPLSPSQLWELMNPTPDPDRTEMR